MPPPSSSNNSPPPRDPIPRFIALEGTGVIDVGRLAEGVLGSDRTAIGRAITLVESTRADHQDLAQELLTRLLPHAGTSHRIGITGVPGAGKSTFVDAIGMFLIGHGHRVAVLAVDPSSKRTGGSILGDKTRMSRLAVSDDAFIRPSPSAGRLGGVTRATRETIVVLEVAGFDVVFVETVGVGQSETSVASMVDTFLLLMLARTGDSLQGIKKGVLELADVIAVNKADGDREQEARAAARELAGALRLVRGHGEWAPPVVTCSALEDVGVDDLWRQVLAHREHLGGPGLNEKRAAQQLDFTWALVRDELEQRLRRSPDVRAVREEIRAAVLSGELPATVAADRILAAYDHPSG
jgi:LAO/AO transport system kinase